MPKPPNPRTAARAAAFATLLRERRAELELTQDRVVELSGISRSTYVRWENGGADKPGADEVRAVCRVLGIRPREAAIVLGWLEPEDAEPAGGEDLPPEVAEAVAILRDPRVPASDKRAWMQYLHYLSQQHNSPPVDNGRQAI